jgi:hypothetical protein
MMRDFAKTSILRPEEDNFSGASLYVETIIRNSIRCHDRAHRHSPPSGGRLLVLMAEVAHRTIIDVSHDEPIY